MKLINFVVKKIKKIKTIRGSFFVPQAVTKKRIQTIKKMKNTSLCRETHPMHTTKVLNTNNSWRESCESFRRFLSIWEDNARKDALEKLEINLGWKPLSFQRGRGCKNCIHGNRAVAREQPLGKPSSLPKATSA